MSFLSRSSIKSVRLVGGVSRVVPERYSHNITSRTRRPLSTFTEAAEKSKPTFPCVEAHADRESRIAAASSTASQSSPTPSSSGPEPPYARPAPTSYKIFHHADHLPLIYGTTLPSFQIAYETWGTLSPQRDNVILLHTGLSASSHAASTSTNPSPGWWENFIGPGKALDTNQFYIICTNVLGGCYGSTGPSSPDPSDPLQEPYATRFPILSILDMVRAQFLLLDHLGVRKLYASVGSSMGAMQSLAAGWLFPERVGKVVSISGTARSSPGSVAMRFAQRSGEPVKEDELYITA
jgi:homoserine acetyltransferase